jgi:transposase
MQADVAGIDLGSLEHWVCCPPAADGTANVRTFGTTSTQLVELADWLAEQKVRSVAMESTGVYWIPLFELLVSRGFEVRLVDTRSLANVPGRKTDMLDCQWIQLLHSCGLLRGAFRPDEAVCRLRELIRAKATLVAERSDWLRRLQKELDQMNIRVHRAVADLSGVTGMNIVRAIVAGERDPRKLAELRDPRCQKSAKAIAEELTGTWRDEHLFNLEQALRMYDFIQEQIGRYEQRIMDLLGQMQRAELAAAPVPAVRSRSKARTMKTRGQEPRREALFRVAGADLTTIDGIGVQVAETLLSELGADLSMFPTEKHFVSFVGKAPALAISGGKALRGHRRRDRRGRTRVAEALAMAALTVRNTETALGAYYRRIARRKGADVAVFATARKIASHVYRLLRYGQPYVDIGAAAYEQRYQQGRIAHLEKAAKTLGYRLVQDPENAVANG